MPREGDVSTEDRKPEPPRKRARKGKPPRKHLVDLQLGPLPTDLINRVLKTELEPGPVVFNTNHQVHVNRRRPAEYARLLPHIAGIVANPMYIGDDHLNPDGFEMIGRVQVLAEWVLVAVKLEPDEAGAYQLATFYPLSDAKIRARRNKGFLRIVVR